MADVCDVFVIGAGVAGMAAAEAAATQGLATILAEAAMFGGLVLNINHLQPAPPGLPRSGADLSADMMMRTADLGVEMIMEPVEALRAQPGGGFAIRTAGGVRMARSVIVASGARLRRLGVPNEAEFQHRGVSTCADCDGPLFRGKPVVVVGGGDSAAQEALVLAEFTDTVHLMHRGAALSARPEFVAAIEASPAISVRCNTEVLRLEGEDGLASVVIGEAHSGQTTTIPCMGFFAMIGLEANADFLPDDVKTSDGWVTVDASMRSSCDGVYAIGAARAGFGGELTHALDDAARAVAAIRERLGAA